MAKRKTDGGQQFFNSETGLYANQITTLLKRTKDKDIRESRGAAYQDLTPAAFALYIFASMDDDHFPRIWSWKSINAWCGMPYSTYRKAINELTTKAYIKDGFFDLGKGMERLAQDQEDTAEQIKKIANEKKEEIQSLINETHKLEKTLKNDSHKREKSLVNESQKREKTLINENQKREEKIEIIRPNSNGLYDF